MGRKILSTKLFKFIASVFIVLILLLTISRVRAGYMHNDVLDSNYLANSADYEEEISLVLFDPFVGLLPHWKVSFTSKTEHHYFYISFFCNVARTSSKDMRLLLLDKGYLSEY